MGVSSKAKNRAYMFLAWHSLVVVWINLCCVVTHETRTIWNVDASGYLLHANPYLEPRVFCFLEDTPSLLGTDHRGSRSAESKVFRERSKKHACNVCQEFAFTTSILSRGKHIRRHETFVIENRRFL